MVIRYRREIDGLRALAVLPVVFFHAGFAGFGGGFVGVDVFFVISGYLITSIILSEKERKVFSFLNFYERRARRILPALFLVLFVCLPLAWIWLLPDDMEKFPESLAAVSLFGSNIFYYKTTGYFDTGAKFSPLMHTWSLSVEEQYYLLFPIFLIFSWRLGKVWIVALLSLVALFSLTMAQWGSHTHPYFTYFMLPTRLWEMVIGALTAFYLFPKMQEGEPHASQAGSALGLGLILFSVVVLNKDIPYPGLYTLLPIAGATLIILFCTEKTWVGRLLGSSVMVGIGLISYSIYLWHQPLFVFARHRSLDDPSAFTFILLSLLSVFLAFLSWKYVETPFRDRNRIKRKAILVFALLGTAEFGAFGLLGIYGHGYPERFDKTYLASIKEIELPTIDNGWCFYSIDTIDSLAVGSNGLHCMLGDKTAAVKGLLFGDSFAGQYEPFWNIIGAKNAVSVNSVTTNWCYPSFTDAFDPKHHTSKAYKQCLINRTFVSDSLSHYDFVILAGRWEEAFKLDELAGTLDVIDKASRQTKLVIVMAAPVFYDGDPGYYFKKAILHERTLTNVRFTSLKNDEAVRDANAILQAAARRYPNVLFIDRNALFNDGQSSDITKDGRPYSWDGAHISIYGSKMAAENYMRSAEYALLRRKLAQIRH